MKMQILPNWFKKVGLIMFIMFSFLGSGDAYTEGYNKGYYYNQDIPTNIKTDSFTNYFGEIFMHSFDIIAIIGMIIYIMSKEKIEDDYINKLRLESYQITALISLFTALILFVFSSQLKFYVDDLITIFLFIYLITFYIKKRIDL